jgi:hypothetical protein
MKPILITLLMCGIIAISGCGKGCGCSAYYKIPKEGGEIQIQFRVVTAETVGGHTDCGFKDIPTRVRSAKVGDVAMKEVAGPDSSYLYVAPAGFDPAKDVVTIDVNGTTYVSTPDSVKRHPESVFFDLPSD